MCVCVCVHACVCACVHERARSCVCVCVLVVLECYKEGPKLVAGLCDSSFPLHTTPNTRTYAGCCVFRLFFSDNQEGHKLLVVQCDCGDLNQNLIKCAQYCMQDLRPQDSTQHHVVFIVQLPRVAGACFTGFLVRSLQAGILLIISSAGLRVALIFMIIDWLEFF